MDIVALIGLLLAISLISITYLVKMMPNTEVKLVYIGTHKIGKNWFIRGEVAVLEFAIRYSSLSRKVLEIDLLNYDDYSLVMRLVKRRVRPALDGMEKVRVEINTRELPIGLYLVQLHIGDKVYTSNTNPKYNYEKYPWIIAVMEPFKMGNRSSFKFPLLKVPYGLGVNIHFVLPRKIDLDMMHLAGISIVRMDLFWSHVERSPKEYNLDGYIQLAQELLKRGMRPLFILDYGNPLYDNGLPPSSELGVRAFAEYAMYVVSRLDKEGNIIWEVWNEPNIEVFWKPKPNATQYAELLKATLKAIRSANPNAVVIAPATSGVDLEFIEKLLKIGALRGIDAISVHPYRDNIPETVLTDYKKLREILAKYGLNLPIVCSEWGYSTWSNGISMRRQAAYVVRMYITNLMEGIPITIIYDWKDDGPDINNAEHNFGLIADYESAGLRLIKPAYFAIYNTARILHDYVVKNYTIKDNVVIVEFINERSRKYVVWSFGGENEIALRVGWSKVKVTNLFGKTRIYETMYEVLSLKVSEEPIFIERYNSG